MSEVKKFTFDVGWAFATQVILLFTGFFLSIILGNSIGASGLGLYSLTLTIYALASIFGGFGISAAVVKFVSEHKENKNKFNIFVSCSIVNSLFLGIFTASLLYFLSGRFADLFGMPELEYLIKIVSLALPFLFVNNIFLSILNGLLEMRLYSFLMIIRSVLLLSLAILFISIGWGVKGPVYAILLSEIGTFALLMFLTKNLFDFNFHDYFRTTKETVFFGGKLFFGGVVYDLNTRTDTILVGYFLTDKDVGIYAIAIALSRTILMIPGAMSTVTYPMISEYHGKKMYKSIENLIDKSMRSSLVILSILGITLISFSQPIISFLLRPEFLSAVEPITILVLGLMLFGSVSSVGSAFSAVGRPDIPLKLNLLAALVNLPLNILLIPVLGIVGAAISTAISFSVIAIMSFYMFKKIMHININILYYLKIMLFATALIITFYIFKSGVNQYLLAILLLGSYFIIVYKVFLIKEDIAYLKKIWKNIL